MATITRALISASDKTGIVEFARGLVEAGVTLISTGGTAALLQDHAIPATPIDAYTQFPEMLDGRVKTLHPFIHAGLLARRDDAGHMATLSEHSILPIDMVVVNLYPFRETIAKDSVSLEEAIENIDIGGPTMLRAAAKNYEAVTVLSDPSDYAAILQEIQTHNGRVSVQTNCELAKKVFLHTARYDGAIANYLSNGDYLQLSYHKVQDLRYGENPHQQAAYYRDTEVDSQYAMVQAQQLHGKALSFNNIMDLDAARALCLEFSESACVIIKHTNPCGVACADTALAAYRKAFSVDAVSAFGSIVGFNCPVDAETAAVLSETFVEAVLAPAFSPEALACLTQKKNIRLLTLPMPPSEVPFSVEKDIKTVSGGILLQDSDTALHDGDLRVVTDRSPTKAERAGLLFAWKVCKHVKSNAIVYATDTCVAGVGAGQMSRLDAVCLGKEKATGTLLGTCLASDAFFPFRDGVDVAAEAGVTAIIQPGGSIRDPEVIAACNAHGIAMLFTGMRHFKH